MTEETISFNTERALRTGHGDKWSVLEMLEHIVKLLKEDKLKPTKGMLILESPGIGFSIHTSCQTIADQVYFLEATKQVILLQTLKVIK